MIRRWQADVMCTQQKLRSAGSRRNRTLARMGQQVLQAWTDAATRRFALQQCSCPLPHACIAAGLLKAPLFIQQARPRGWGGPCTAAHGMMTLQ